MGARTHFLVKDLARRIAGRPAISINFEYTVSCITASCVTAALILMSTTAILAQDSEGRLGLSASADSYNAELETVIGEPFTLYAILTGPDEQTTLDFGLQWVQWAVFTACCGDSPVAVTAIDYVDGVVAEDVVEEGIIELNAPDCLDGEVVLIAALTFEWLLEGETSFPVSAGPISAALDCSDGVHLISGLVVDIIGVESTPTATASWSSLKADYRASPTPEPGGQP